MFEDADYSFEFVDGNIVSMVADDGDGVRGPLMSFDRRTLRMVTPTPVEYPKDLVWRTRWNTPIGPVILVNNRSGGVSTNEDKCWELWVTNSARDMFPRTPPLAGDKKSIESDEDEGPPGFTRLVKLPRPKDWGTYDVHITGEVVNTATGPKQEVNIHVVEEFNEGVSTVARAQEVASSAPRQEHLHPRKVVKIVYGRDHQSLFDGVSDGVLAAADIPRASNSTTSCSYRRSRTRSPCMSVTLECCWLGQAPRQSCSRTRPG